MLWGSVTGLMEMRTKSLATFITLAAAASSAASDLIVVHSLKAHSGMAYAAAFSPDSAVLATGGVDRKVNFRAVSNGSIIRTLGPLPGRIDCVTFSSDGKLLAAGGEHRTVKVWNTRDWSEIGDLKVRGRTSVNSVAFSQDGRWLAAGSEDDTVTLWNASTWQEARVLKGHSSPVYAVEFLSDGDRLRSSDSSSIRIWKIDTGALLETIQPPESGGALSPDGKFWVTSVSPFEALFSSAAKGTAAVKLWDRSTGTLVRALKGGLWDGPLAFSPRGEWLVTRSYGGTQEGGLETVNVWETSTGRRVASLPLPGTLSARFAPNGALLVTTGEDGVVRLLRVSDATESPSRGP